MEKIFELLLKYLAPILTIIIGVYFNKKIEKYKMNLNDKLDLMKEKRNLITKTQKDLLFIIQNLFYNGYKSGMPILEKLEFLISETENNELKNKNYVNKYAALFSVLGLNTTSKNVMKIRLYLQEEAYKRLEGDNFINLVSFSLLYKYLYEDYFGIEIEDLYLLKYILNDFYENESEFKKLVRKVKLEIKCK